MCPPKMFVDTFTSGTGQDQIEHERTNWGFINGQTGHRTLATACKVSDFYGKPSLLGSEGYTHI